MEGAQTRGMLALAMALVVVMGVLFAQGEPEAEGDPDATESVWTVDASLVERIAIRPAGRDEQVLVRTTTGWDLLGTGRASTERVRYPVRRSISGLKRRSS